MQRYSNPLSFWTLAIAAATLSVVGCGSPPPAPDTTGTTNPETTPEIRPESEPNPEVSRDAEPPTTPEASGQTVATLPNGQVVKVDPDGNAQLQTEIDGVRSEINVAAEDSGIALPAGFPQELTYDGAQVKLTQWSDTTVSPVGSVILATEDSVEAVTTHYRSQLERSGWSALGTPFSATTAEGSANVLSAQKGRTFLVATIAAGEDDTLITLQLQPQQ